MTSDDFWVDARRRPNRGWMDRAAAKADEWRAAREPAPEPEPVVPGDDSIGALDLAAYAQVRDQLGIRSASDFAGLDRRVNESGFPDAARYSAEQLRELGLGDPYRVHERPGETPRQYGIPASMVESIGGHRGRGVVS